MTESEFELFVRVMHENYPNVPLGPYAIATYRHDLQHYSLERVRAGFHCVRRDLAERGQGGRMPKPAEIVFAMPKSASNMPALTYDEPAQAAFRYRRTGEYLRYVTMIMLDDKAYPRSNHNRRERRLKPLRPLHAKTKLERARAAYRLAIAEQARVDVLLALDKLIGFWDTKEIIKLIRARKKARRSNETNKTDRINAG